MEFTTGKDHGKIEQVEMNFLFYGNVSSQFAPLGIFKVTRFFKFQMNPDSGGGWGGGGPGSLHSKICPHNICDSYVCS